MVRRKDASWADRLASVPVRGGKVLHGWNNSRNSKYRLSDAGNRFTGPDDGLLVTGGNATIEPGASESGRGMSLMRCYRQPSAIACSSLERERHVLEPMGSGAWNLAYETLGPARGFSLVGGLAVGACRR